GPPRVGAGPPAPPADHVGHLDLALRLGRGRGGGRRGGGGGQPRGGREVGGRGLQGGRLDHLGRGGGGAGGGGGATTRRAVNAPPTARAIPPSGTSTYNHQRRPAGASAWRA